MSWLAVGIASLIAAAGLFLHDRLRRRRDEAQAYLKGMRSMLSDDPDAAIEALSDAARLGSPEAVETYLALGALFRRTGDISRAMRLHRNMLLRPGLDPARRDEVERELAHDYRRSGMLRESAEAYRKLAGRGDRAAAEGLRDVLVELGELRTAADVQRRLSGGRPDALLAHLLAGESRQLLERDRAAARLAAEEATGAHPASSDALIALAEAEAAMGRDAPALEALGRALDTEPASALLAWSALAAIRERAAAVGFVEGRLDRTPGDGALHLLHGRLLRLAGRAREALAALRRALEHDATGEVTLAMRELLREAEAPAPDELAARHDLLVTALLRAARPLRCRRCGAGALTRTWRCSRCGTFDAYGSDAR